MRTPSLVRRTYDSLALVALLNVLGAGALIGFLVNSGAMSAEIFRSLAMVVRGEGVVVPPESVVDGVATEEEKQANAEAAMAEVSETGLEMLRLEAVRIKAELDQPVNPYAWQNFHASISLPKQGYYEIWARATSDKGVAQPHAIAWNPKGYLNNSMHRIAVRYA